MRVEHQTAAGAPIGYVLKRYPRYSETFIVSEILAHEAAGQDVRIFASRPCYDAHFQDVLARVRAPVSYLGFESVRCSDFWTYLTEAASEFPHAPQVLLPGIGESPFEVCQGIELARQATAAGVRHLHAHFGTSAATIARIASLLSGIPFTFTAHAKDVFHNDVDRAALERKIEAAAACVTVSDFNLHYLESWIPAARGKAVRVYNGIDLTAFEYEAPLHREPVIVGIGRLVEKKGFADLVAACAALRAANQRFTCRIVGSGPLEGQLRSQIRSLALEDVVSLTGPRPQAEVRREVQAAAVVAAPCVVSHDGDRDGLPTVLLEAMALGTPCVSTPVTGIPEAIEDEHTGLLVPEHDAAALAAALQRLLREPPLRVRLADAARRHVEERFASERNAAALRELFDRVSQPQPLAR
jgi:colanic acid/amylovoran biosynthesis glycosyltransferase